MHPTQWALPLLRKMAVIGIAMVSNALGFDWNWTSYPQTNNLSGICYAGGHYVAIGNVGTVLTSTDGQQWSAARTNTRNSFNGITYAGGQFRVLGNGGMVYSSPDGLVWDSVQTPTTLALTSLAYGKGLYVASGRQGQMASSKDFRTWTLIPASIYDNIQAILFHDDQFLLVGQNGAIFTSPDAITWTRRSSGTTHDLNSLVHDGSHYFAAGDSGTVLRSKDGVVWTDISAPTKEKLLGIATGDGRVVAVGTTSTSVSSVHDSTWTPSTMGTPSATLSTRAVAFAEGRFIAVGNRGIIYHSTDGVTWSSPEPYTRDGLRGLHYHDGTFVAVGFYGIILSSTDARNWKIRQSGFQGRFLGAVTYGKGRFIACDNLDTLYASPNGIAWAPLATGTKQSINHMTFDGRQFVAVGYPGSIATSPDGEHWTVQSLPDIYYLTSVANVNNRYIAVGEIIATSPDATTWTVVTERPKLQLTSVAYGNGVYVAVGISGTVMTSTDAITWTDKSISTNSDWFSQIIFTGSEFLAVSSSGTVHTSTDGTEWNTEYTPTYNALYAVVQTEDKLVAAGEEGTLLVANHGYTTRVAARDGRGRQVFSAKLDRQFLTVTLDKDSWAGGGNRVELFTMSGRRVFSSQVGATSGPIRLGIQDLPRDCYIARVGPYRTTVVKR